MPTNDVDSISCWIEAVRTGDEDAAQNIWDRYFPDLVRLAERKLAGQRPARGGAEDAALSALGSFYKAAKMGRFPELHDRHDLWRLLRTMTQRKAANIIRYNGRRPEVGESHLGGRIDESAAIGLQNVPGSEAAGPIFAASLEEVGRLLDLLDDKERLAVELRLQGYSNKEIAQRCGRAEVSVERYLKAARDKWETEWKRIA